MSFQVTTHFVQQYRDRVMHLAPQKGSRLRNTIMLETVTGESAFFDRIGVASAQKRTSRHADTPLIETPHSRRKVNLADYEWADLIDQVDKVRMLNDPQSDYVMVGANAMGRSMDDVIIAAIGGTALTGKDGSGSQALPAAQKIAAGGAGLTSAKLISAKEKLDAAEVADDDRHFVGSAKQYSDLLNTTEVQSSDFNTVRALVRGDIDTWLGFKFVRSARLKASGSNRLCYAYRKTAMKLAMGKEPQAKISERADKSYSVQVYYCMALGAVRMEEVQAVEIACLES